MNTKQITIELIENHLNFSNYIAGLSVNDYEFSYQNKWNAGQHLDHIIKSVAVLTKAFGVPKFILKSKFGIANRASRSSDDLIERYLEKLKTAKPTPSRFQPVIINFSKREKTISLLHKKVDKLCKRAMKFSEKDLDYYILPHPLLGKLTLIELLYFTNYHVKHHGELLKKALKNK
ncbi:MAG TPA: DinB family protein [Candidatus Aenigmarchaeota archaeon]|nr:DinB family protein [Candidatus Aenigmarchaeota archaeon]